MKNYYKTLYNKEPQNLKILLVGAGGIGCQFVKNVYKTAHQVTIIDYDTISQTNLNRQFCYRRQDIGKHKVDVLSQYFRKLNPHFHIKTQKNNLYEYNSLYFSQFNILVSALDNNQARCYLNKMAVDNNLPMIDAGTSGYNGQAQYFIRHRSECRMCRPQLGQQINYAVCSLRGRPERNVHCVHFGLYLYREIGNIHSKLHAYKSTDAGTQTQTPNKSAQSQQWSSLSKLFVHKISQYTQEQLIKTCISLHNTIFDTNLLNCGIQGIQPIQYQQNRTVVNDTLKAPANKQNISIVQQLQNNDYQYLLHSKLLTTPWYSHLFVQSAKQLLTLPKWEDYDKDSFIASLFIYATANLRINNFSNAQHSRLRPMTYYECKDMSGKIIPAIASTNSIAAAIQAQLITKIFNNPQQTPKYISIKSYASQYKVQSLLSQKPKPNCQNCSHLYNYAQICMDMYQTTWGQLQAFLSDNFDESIQYRDMRCNQYLLIRNSGVKPWRSNKGKLVSFNHNLIQLSKLGYETITIKYIPTAELINLNKQNTQNNQYFNTWKFVLLHDVSKTGQKIYIRKALKKQEYKINIAKAIQEIKQMKQYQFNTKIQQNDSLCEVVHEEQCADTKAVIRKI